MTQVDQESIETYRALSKELTNSSFLLELRKLFERKYTLAELLEWLHDKVKWGKGEIIRHTDPTEILAYGKGRCGEFSILFTALCLAHDYRTRLILDMSDHVWTEIWNADQNRWIHVDPSEKRIDDPQMYERSWKKCLREVYAFENGNIENVTKNYKIVSASTNCRVNHRKKSIKSENYK